MIKLQGTLIERLEQALSLICTEASDEQVRHFHDIYEKAGITPTSSAEKFFRKYGGNRDSYIMLSDPKYNDAISLWCYGNDDKTGNLDYAMQDIDLIRETVNQEVCPIGMIGYDIPAEVYIGEDGLLYCRYDFKEEIDIFESPSQILEYYLRNNVPIGVDKKPIRRKYEENVSWAEPTYVSQTIHFSNNPETGLMGMTVEGNQPIAVDKAAEDRLGLQKIVNAQKKQTRQKQLLVKSAGKR